MADGYRYYFTIQQQPGGMVEKKIPMQNECHEKIARELKKLYPNAVMYRVTVTPNDLWIDTLDDFIFQQEAFDAMHKAEQEEEDKNNKLLAELREKFGEKYVADIIDCLKDDECDGELSIVDTPGGKRQNENWGSFKFVHVNQYVNGGMEGDSFAGYVYIPLPDGKFLKSHYSM